MGRGIGRIQCSAVRRLIFTTVLSLALAAPALGYIGPEERRGDLDGDGNNEVVKSVPVPVAGTKDFQRTAIDVSDECAGITLVKRVAGPQDNLALLRLKRADTVQGREVFVELRSGASAKLGEARVVAWRPAGSGGCGTPRDLFAYNTDRHTRTPRRGNGDIFSFGVSLRDRVKAYKGLEVALEERFYRRGDPAVYGSILKRTYWRYSRKTDRYVRYVTRVKYLRQLRPE